MSDRLTLTAELGITAANTGKPARVELVGYTGAPMKLAGFSSPVLVDLAGVSMADELPLLADHDASLNGIVGRINPSVQNGQLVAFGTISNATEAGRTVVALARDGVRFQASIGGNVEHRRHVREGETVTANGRTFTADRGGLTVASKIDIREISIVPIGADGNTTVSIAAKGKTMTVASDQDVLTQERARVARINELTAGDWGDSQPGVDRLRASALKDDISPDDLAVELVKVSRNARELEAIRASRPQAPSGFNGKGAPQGGSVLTASLAMSMGADADTLGKEFGEDTVSEAMSARHRGAGFHACIRSVLRATGQHFDTIDDHAIRLALSADVDLKASGFSTLSLPGILSNAANKSMLSTYNAQPTTWRAFCGIGNMTDFKEATKYRLTGQGEFTEVGADGELKHFTLGEESYSNRLTTRGSMLGVTRQMLINDDLDAFAQVPRIIGRQSAIAVEKAVYVKLLSNPDGFFATANKNLLHNNAMGVDSLTALEKLFLDRTDTNGDPVLIQPAVVLVPTDLAVTATLLLNATQLRDNTADVQYLAANPHAGKFQSVVSPYLSNTTYAGASSSAWYLASDPSSGVAMMEVGFLNGRQTPTIDTAEADFNKLGIQMRGYFDFGVAMQDDRAAVKATGVLDPEA